LHKKNRVYRKDAPAMFCPNCQTGVAQVELKDKELESTFNDIAFKVNSKDLIISTTRPELLPACVAIFYSPGDKRYEKLKGKKATVPLFNYEVPILEDKRVDPELGTGIAMCCTFGDQVDMDWQKAYKLPIKMAISPEGRMTKISGNYEGMSIREARKAMLKDLKVSGLLKKQKPIKHIVNVHERCGTEIEFIKSKQWFVRYLDLKPKLLTWGNKIKWYPPYMKHRYDNWVKGLQWDWLISNQRHFGVPFPVWYCTQCDNIILAKPADLPVDPLKDPPPVKQCPKCKSSQLIPETDILNTWFTSSMTPQIATGLVPKPARSKLFPMDLRPQAHDIITFWLFNTVVKSNLHFNKNPWKETVISGFVTLDKQKMSKSKGNIVEPQEIIEKYGADAIRYWAASSKPGEDLDYQEKDVVTGKKFATKILNATNFVFMNIKHSQSKPTKLHETDRLFLSQLNKLIKTATQSFEEYNYSAAKIETDKFFWRVFADNYLEIVKNRVYNGTLEQKESASYTLYHTLLTILKLMAPITPFITEEIYQQHFKKHEKKKSIHLESWPSQIKVRPHKDDEKIWNKLLNIIALVRQEKSKAKKSMNSPIVLTIPKSDQTLLKNLLNDLQAVTAAKELREGKFKVDFL